MSKNALLISLLCILHFPLLKADQSLPWPKTDFIPPFAGEIEIIGTYCELRPNHFHGGLDIRTGGKIGRHVLSIGDGYISRINISNTGYGKALYITHPNGYTSVYAHLHDFPEKIKWYIRKRQYQLRQYEVELYPEADLLHVRKGEMVAYSGNTGSSQGPHLHFEIRETLSEAPVNPLLCGIRMQDHMAPAMLNLYLYRKDSLEKQYNGHYPSIALPLYGTHSVKKGKKTRKVQHAIVRHTLAYGTYALGANLKDYARSPGDNNGVNYTQVYRDGELIYDCRMERFLFSQMRMHNNYTDYRRTRQSGIKMHKLFRDDGNTLPFYENSPGDGWFEIKDSTPHEFLIVAKDAYGHKTEKRIILQGAPDGRKVSGFIRHEKQRTFCKADAENNVEVSPEFRVFFPRNALYADYRVSCSKIAGHSYVVGDVLVPLDKKIELRFRLNPLQVPYADKFTVFSTDGKKYGGELIDKNWLSVPVKEFSSYRLVLDTVAPVIRTLHFNRNGYFSFSVSDGISGVKDFGFYINGEWVLLEYDSKSGLISGRIPSPLASGTHTVELSVRDMRLNEKKITRNITIP